MGKRDDDDWEFVDPFKFMIGCIEVFIEILETLFSLVKSLLGRLK
jgi:hypothetical protein